MKVITYEITVPLNGGESALKTAAAKRLGLANSDLRLLKILRRSIDARPRRSEICYVINAAWETSRTLDLAKLKKVEIYSPLPPLSFTAEDTAKTAKNVRRPLIIGAGPAGLTAAFVMAKSGAAPIIIERGQPLSVRQFAVGKFWGRGIFDADNNVLFGEGGAGAFSDGKLTSRTKDLAAKNFFLEMLVECGAAPEILFDANPHLGSDQLAEIIPQWRKTIEQFGGEFRFGARVVDFVIEDGKLRGVKIGDEIIEADTVLLATGHSADDIYEILSRRGAQISAKGYALGVRIELPQNAVNYAQFGNNNIAKKIGAASFFLTNEGKCHSFCMCPGGRVIACAANENRLFTNGMSLAAREGKFANAAFLLPQNPPAGADGFAVLRALSEIEEKVFHAGGSDYSLPVTSLADFPNAPRNLPPTSCSRIRPTNFGDFLPAEIIAGLQENLPKMLAKFLRADTNLSSSAIAIYGAETRSSSPLRIERDENYECVGIRGIFPVGEGAGWAGGIVSSAIDGLRGAIKSGA